MICLVVSLCVYLKASIVEHQIWYSNMHYMKILLEISNKDRESSVRCVQGKEIKYSTLYGRIFLFVSFNTFRLHSI